MNKFYHRVIFQIIVICFLSQQAMAQPRWRYIVSPEVHANRTVTFRFLAPDVEKVELSTQFVKDLQPMTQDTTGLWTVTLGSVDPDIYPYHFIVDGIRVADPNNILMFSNERFKNSLVDIPGETPLIHSL